MAIVSHPANKEYLSNYDQVFGKRTKTADCVHRELTTYVVTMCACGKELERKVVPQAAKELKSRDGGD